MSQWFPVIPFRLEVDGNVRCAVFHKEMEKNYPAHEHDYVELEFILEGSGRQWVNDQLVPFQPGCLFLLSTKDYHRLESDSPTWVLSLHILPEMLLSFGLPALENAYTKQLPEAVWQPCAQRLIALAAPERKGLPYYEQEVLATALPVIIDLLRSGSRYHLSKPGKRLQHALRYIQEHHAAPSLCLQEVANVCGLSPTYFSKVFGESVGCHFADYVLSYRLQHACALLKTTDASITEIAYDVGFSGLAHFFRCFRRVLDCTPGEYRRQNSMR